MILIGVNELQKLTGQAQKTVTERLKAAGIEGTPGPRNSIQYESDQALSVLLCGGRRLDPGQEKARLDKTRREVQELVLAEKRGELVSRAAVLETWQSVLASVRAKFLSLPTKGATMAMSAVSLPEAEDVLRRLGKGAEVLLRLFLRQHPGAQHLFPVRVHQVTSDNHHQQTHENDGSSASFSGSSKNHCP